MNVKDFQSTYTMRDMVKMFERVDELTREKNALAKELETKDAELVETKAENAALTAQLDELQADLARQMTAPHILRRLS